MEFKDWLRQQILNKGYTQEEFGEMVGVTGPAVNSWLQGRRKPTIKRAINIAKVLRISPEDVLCIQSNAYWIEKALEKEAEGEYEKIIINKLANIGYLANQAISDLTEE